VVTLDSRYLNGRQLHADPAVWVFDGFASRSETAALRAAAVDLLKPAQLSGAMSGYLGAGRTGENCWVRHDHGPVIKRLAMRVSDLVGLPLNQAESFQVVHYGPGQEYRAHYDAWDASTESGRRCMARGGQRLVTTLLYLNDVEAGGATGFPQLALEVQPVAGTLLLFHNCGWDTTSRPHPSSLHGGLPVVAGEKWAANLWFRERALR
jgi:prolyl 4-hydroxylase